MSTQTNNQVPWYGNAKDWASVLSGIGQGSSSMMNASIGYATSKEEAKEAKRRTLANLMNNAMKRSHGMYRVGEEYSDEMNDAQSQSLQNVARGLVESLYGSTRRR